MRQTLDPWFLRYIVEVGGFTFRHRSLTERRPTRPRQCSATTKDAELVASGNDSLVPHVASVLMPTRTVPCGADEQYGHEGASPDGHLQQYCGLAAARWAEDEEPAAAFGFGLLVFVGAAIVYALERLFLFCTPVLLLVLRSVNRIPLLSEILILVGIVRFAHQLIQQKN